MISQQVIDIHVFIKSIYNQIQGSSHELNIILYIIHTMLVPCFIFN